MDIPETRAILQRVATYDHRPLTDDMVKAWQYALVRHPIETIFDAVTDHYDDCDTAHTVPLTPAEILAHIRRTRDQAEETERKQRDRQRNESIFGELTDHRTDHDRASSLAAMRAGRRELDAILDQRRTTAGLS